MARRTMYIYVLSHIKTGSINNYFFKCNDPDLQLTARLKNKLARLLSINTPTGHFTLEKAENIRTIELE